MSISTTSFVQLEPEKQMHVLDMSLVEINDQTKPSEHRRHPLNSIDSGTFLAKAQIKTKLAVYVVLMPCQ